MKTIIKLALVALGVAVLVACGGSSGGGVGPQGPSLSVDVDAATTSLPANPGNFAPDPNGPYTTSVTVEVRTNTGQAVPAGTPVTLSTSNSSIGVVSSQDEPGVTGNTATATTSGGVASFWFTSRSQPGNVTLTGSATGVSGNVFRGTTQITVTPNEGPEGRLTLTGSSTMPANVTGVPIFLGSPYINEITVTYRDESGNVGSASDGQIAASIAPVTLAAYSTLDDPETEDVNEFFVLMGGGPVNMAAGQSTIFVHSFDQPGNVVLTIQVQDASTGEIVSDQFPIQIVQGGADFLPAQISLDTAGPPLYVQGSGGQTSRGLSVSVLDSAGSPVPNPESGSAGFNNVRLELAEPLVGGARLVGTSATGGSVSGQSINVPTVNGIATFSLNAGTETGQHRIIATADRADNNVDNDIQTPVTAEAVIQVGDGKLFDLQVVTPSLSAIRVNRTVQSFFIDTDEEFETGPDGLPIPPDPDGTYSLTVTVQGTDQAGNPALPGTPVFFGKIDAPLTPTNPADFVFSGVDGNPQEGGTLFSVLNPPEGFLTNPGGPNEAVEPGDTVALFGDLVPGNREHEAARTVANVVDNNSLHVTQPFNPNNQTGSVVNDGHVIPWVIGRSQVGVVDQNATLGQQGRASVRLTYPINAIGRPLVLWAQGNRAEGGGTKTVADVNGMFFPGVAPLLLTASPNQVAGNSTAAITLCLSDGLGAPIAGVFINAARASGDGIVSLDGNVLGDSSTPDGTANATGIGGCVVTQLTTQNMTSDGDEIVVVFFVGSAQAEVTVVSPGEDILIASPSQINDTIAAPVPVSITLTLTSASGVPVSGAQLIGECPSDGVTLQSGPGSTDANGQTQAVLLVDLASCDGGGEATCTFSRPSGNPSTTVNIVGTDLSATPPVSPQPPCP